MNPIVIKTKPGMKTLGRLMRQWTMDPSSRPDGTLEHDRFYVITRDVFIETVEAEGMTEGVDYYFRDGVDSVELLVRREDRAVLPLPEPAVIREIMAQSGEVTVPVPSSELYRDDMSGATLKWLSSGIGQAVQNGDPMYKLFLGGDDPFDEFLDSYMAAYAVTQCR